MLLLTVEGIEDGFVQLFQCLVSPDLDGTRDIAILLGETLLHWTAYDEDV